MTIRNVNLDDLPQLTVLFDLYRQFYSKDSDLQAAQEFLTERINQQDSEIYVCETEDNQLAGFVQLYPLFSSTRMKKFWLLNDLFVHPNYRGNGFSTQLIERAKVLVKETNACGMYLETEKNNLIGNHLYPSTGFELNTECNFYEWHNR